MTRSLLAKLALLTVLACLSYIFLGGPLGCRIEHKVRPVPYKPRPRPKPPPPLPEPQQVAVVKDGALCCPVPALIYDEQDKRFSSYESSDQTPLDRIFNSAPWFNTKPYSTIRAPEKVRKALEKLGGFQRINYGPGFSVGLRSVADKVPKWKWKVWAMEVWAWGANGVGQLGDGTTEDHELPVRIKDLDAKGIVDVACGGAKPEEGFCVAWDFFGRVWSWGCNKYGQLGDGTFQDRKRPVRIWPLDGITLVSCGRTFAVAKDERGRVWAWGDNRYGQLGDGTRKTRPVPKPVKTPPFYCCTLEAGYWHVVASFDHRPSRMRLRLMSWGRNHRGQLGDGTFEDRLRPVWVKLERQWCVPSARWNTSGASDLSEEWECIWGEVEGILPIQVDSKGAASKPHAPGIRDN